MSKQQPSSSCTNVQAVRQFLLDYQQSICAAMENLDEAGRFHQDPWQRPEGGGGLTCVLNGKVFEKAGVNFSHIYGASLPTAATKTRPELAGKAFEALGVSIVIHPENPFVPTTHANIRYFTTTDDHDNPIWWFGGGFDLTPYYGFDEDCKHWHQMARLATHPFEDSLYPLWKKACDEYFFLPHRQETRGIGGLFFDDFNQPDFHRCFALFKNVGKYFWEGYYPIVERRKNTGYEPRHKAFQKYRRGRYVEFNLLYDRGTLFGLQSQGRTESILMSLPPEVSFIYDWHPTPGSPEDELYQNYLIPRDWAK